ncbi:MAG TPA: glutathione S-transferase family protein [Solirubrobacteraceae bacterium]|nr:glutathione S-transferase family protein [Solirubrobacteraceae bacterium]
MRLYNSAVSGNCWKVRQMLAHLGVRADGSLAPTPDELAARSASPLADTAEAALSLELLELDVVDRSERASLIGHLSPVRRVPVLVLDDGRALFESNAIIDFLAEGTPYLPTDAHERQQALAWQFFEQYEIEPNLAVARFYRIFALEPPEGLMGQKEEAGRRGLEALERGLTGREFLVGGRYTVADISLYAYTHVAAEGGFDLEPFPWVRAWLARVAAQPGHRLITD